MVTPTLVNRSEPEVRGFLVAVLASEEWFVLVSDRKDGLLEEIDRLYFGFDEDDQRKHISVVVRVPCDLLVETQHGTRRRVRDHVALAFQKSGCSAETLASVLRQWHPCGIALDVRAKEHGGSPFANVTAQVLDANPIVSMYQASEFSTAAIMELVNHFRTWLRIKDVVPFERFTAEELRGGSAR